MSSVIDAFACPSIRCTAGSNTRPRQFELQQVDGPDMAFRDAVTFEVAVAGLCQLGAIWPPPLGHRLNDMQNMEKMKESA
jgi:hypothetical protein